MSLTIDIEGHKWDDIVRSLDYAAEALRSEGECVTNSPDDCAAIEADMERVTAVANAIYKAIHGSEVRP